MAIAQRIDVHHLPSPPSYIITELNDSVIEYATDTSRAIGKLLPLKERAKGLAECDFTAEERLAIDCGNARRLLPLWERT